MDKKRPFPLTVISIAWFILIVITIPSYVITYLQYLKHYLDYTNAVFLILYVIIVGVELFCIIGFLNVKKWGFVGLLLFLTWFIIPRLISQGNLESLSGLEVFILLSYLVLLQLAIIFWPKSNIIPLNDFSTKELKRIKNASLSIQILNYLLCVLNFALFIYVIWAIITNQPQQIIFILIISFFIQLIAIIGAFKRTNWGKIINADVWTIALIVFPFGTIIGGVALYFYIISWNILFGKNKISHKKLLDEIKYRENNDVEEIREENNPLFENSPLSSQVSVEKPVLNGLSSNNQTNFKKNISIISIFFIIIIIILIFTFWGKRILPPDIIDPEYKVLSVNRDIGDCVIYLPSMSYNDAKWVTKKLNDDWFSNNIPFEQRFYFIDRKVGVNVYGCETILAAINEHSDRYRGAHFLYPSDLVSMILIGINNKYDDRALIITKKFIYYGKSSSEIMYFERFDKKVKKWYAIK